MNITHVVDILLYSAKVIRCPEIFLLLPTCSILHEQHNIISLVLPLAVAITDLNETAMKSLSKTNAIIHSCTHSFLCRSQLEIRVNMDENRNPCSFMERQEVILIQICHLYFLTSSLSLCIVVSSMMSAASMPLFCFTHCNYIII